MSEITSAEILQIIEKTEDSGDSVHFHKLRFESKNPAMKNVTACLGASPEQCLDHIHRAEVAARMEERLWDLNEDVLTIAYPVDLMKQYAEETQAVKNHLE